MKGIKKLRILNEIAIGGDSGSTSILWDWLCEPGTRRISG